MQRDVWLEKALHGAVPWSFAYTPEQRGQQAQMISLGIQTEMILENASNLAAPFLLWAMFESPTFMATAPSQLTTKGKYPG